MISILRCYLFFFLTVSSVSLATAQSDGIKFEHNLSWSAILAKAKAEQKYIFMDCSATWCAPCRYMAQKVFTEKAIADYFNEHFINVAVQMDRTANDPEEIKSWYADAASIGSKYTIGAYPTFLFFSPDGKAVDRFVGGFEADEFLAKAKDALNPEKQYYTFINNYKDHLHDSVFLRSALIKALASVDNQRAAKIAEFYLGSVRDSFSIDNISLLVQIQPPTSSELFQFCLENAERVDTILGIKGGMESRLCTSIRNEQIEPLFKDDGAVVDYNFVLHDLQNKYPKLASILRDVIDVVFNHFIRKNLGEIVLKQDVSEPDWKAVAQFARIHYPGYSCTQLIDEIKPSYYKYKKMWPECEKSVLELLNRYGDQMIAAKMNDLIWNYLFMYSSDPKILRIALKWSKRAVDMSPEDCDNVDTYANLLYKLGDLQEALNWEKKAVEQCGSQKTILSSFEKMKKGEKTWTGI